MGQEEVLKKKRFRDSGIGGRVFFQKNTKNGGGGGGGVGGGEKGRGGGGERGRGREGGREKQRRKRENWSTTGGNSAKGRRQGPGGEQAISKAFG